MEQRIQFCTTGDGVRIAYGTVGQGAPLVKAANWLSHLEYDLQSPVWRHWIAELSRGHAFVRYDARGCGLSDWDVPELSFEAWVRDLETVVDAARVERFALLGLSQGGAIAIAYAVRHPDRVTHLMLHGAFAPRRAPAQPDAAPAQGSRDDGRARGAGLGQGEPRLPPVLHEPVHPRRHARAASLVEPARAGDHLARERGALHARAGRDRRHRARAPRRLSRRSSCTPFATRGSRSRRDACSRASSRARASSRSTAETTSCSSTSPPGGAGSRRCARSCRSRAEAAVRSRG